MCACACAIPCFANFYFKKTLPYGFTLYTVRLYGTCACTCACACTCGSLRRFSRDSAFSSILLSVEVASAKCKWGQAFYKLFHSSAVCTLQLTQLLSAHLSGCPSGHAVVCAHPSSRRHGQRGQRDWCDRRGRRGRCGRRGRRNGDGDAEAAAQCDLGGARFGRWQVRL